MGRITNAIELTKSSWKVLRKDQELIAVPAITGFAAVVVFLVIAAPGLLMMGGGSEETSSGNIASYLIFILALTAATWVSAIGQAAVVSGAAERMDGGDPTIGSAFAAAKGRAGRLLEWAIMATVVSIILDQIEERLGVIGRLVSWVGSVAFSVMSFLALPVIVFEDVGAIEGFKRSSRLLKSTWGEQVSFNFGMGLLGMVALVPGVLVAGLLLGTGVLPLQAIGGGIGMVWVVGVIATVSALSAVYKTALYRWANGLPVDPAYSESDFTNAFTPKR